MSRARDNANLSPTIADARMPNLTGDITTVEGAVATTIANDAVDSQHYAAGSIDNEHLADDAVGSDELANNVVIDTSGAITTTGINTSGGSIIADGTIVFDKPSVKGYRLLTHDVGHDLSIQQGDTDNANYVTKFNISTDGDVKVNTGNLVIPTADKGIYFSGGTDPDTSGSITGGAAGNTLTDYEEGTWTPGLSTYTTQSGGGSYIKVGKIVHFEGILGVTTVGLGNTSSIVGLPFIPKSSGGVVGDANCGYAFNLAANVIAFNIIIYANTSSLYLHGVVGATDDIRSSDTNVNHNLIGAGVRIDFSGTYHTS